MTFWGYLKANKNTNKQTQNQNNRNLKQVFGEQQSLQQEQ